MSARQMKKVRKIVSKEFHKDLYGFMNLKFWPRLKLCFFILFKIKDKETNHA